jgi:Ca2+-binding RTX toxin-like protein
MSRREILPLETDMKNRASSGDSIKCSVLLAEPEADHAKALEAQDQLSGPPGPQRSEGPTDEIPSLWVSQEVLEIGGSRTGLVNHLGDADGYRVELVAGQSYVFTMTGSGDTPLEDPYLELYFENQKVAIDDDGGPGRGSLMRYTATVSGSYWVNARAWEDNGVPSLMGGYTLAAAIGPPQNPLDSIDLGFAVPTTNISVYFATFQETFDGVVAIRSWNQSEIAAAMSAMATFSAVTNLTFTQAASAAGATFILSLSNLPGNVLGQFSTISGTGYGVFDTHPSFWSPEMLQPGGLAYSTILHEIGHGLGLAHPHDNGGVDPDDSSEIMQGVFFEFNSYGTFGFNQGAFTIMSYNRGAPTYQTLVSDIFGAESTPGPLDIAILQQKYGVNPSTNAGDNVYALEEGHGPGRRFQAIWDVGGTDSIVYEGRESVVIDLRAATLLTAPGGAGGLSYVQNGSGGYSIANGVVIETALSGSGFDKLYGGFGANILSAGAGDDLLSGGSGADVLNGGDGDDRVSFEDNPSGVRVNLLLQTATDGWGDTDTLSSIEYVTGSSHDDVLIGGLASRAGFGSLIGDMQGGDGDDYLEDHSANLGHIAFAVLGGRGDDTLVKVGAAGAAFMGEEGDDWLVGGDGSDVLQGGGGNDILHGNLNGDGLYGGEGADSLSGGAGNDSLDGGTGDDTLDGGDGDDFLAGATGGDRYIGGAGRDTVRYGAYEFTDDNKGVTVDLTVVGPQDTAASGIDVFDGIENLEGTFFSDTFTGNDGANVLTGFSGDDTLRGGGGDDTLNAGEGDDLSYGGAGNDFIYGPQVDHFLSHVLNEFVDGGDGQDTVTFEASYAGVTLSLAITTPQVTINSGAITLLSIENLIGTRFEDSLTGDLSANRLVGGDGDDLLFGDLGDDTLMGEVGADLLLGGAGVDTASYASASQRVVVNLSLTVAQDTLGAGLDTLTGIENLTGSAFNDSLTGDNGNNILVGGAGVDTLIGGLGDDVLIGGDNTDFIVDAAGVVSIDGGIGNEQITVGAGVVSGTVDGGSGTDSLTKGGSIAGLVLTSIEILNTNGGTVTGRADQFEGFDTIRFSIGQVSTAVNLALSEAGVVDLTDELLGRRANVTGTSGNDTITTSNIADQIDGGAGDDVLSGNAGNDTLIGSLGDDQLNGGGDTDFIVDLSGIVAIDAGDGDDVITLGALLNAGTVAGGLGSDQLNKGGAIAGLTISGIEIVNTNGGTLLATADQLEGFDTIRFSAAQSTTAVSLALSEAGVVDLSDELLGRRALFAGTSGNDIITTSNGSDQVDGGAGDDILTGNAGVDTLIGGVGDDTLAGGDGGDFLVDLAGIVAIDGGDGDDVLTVGAAVTAGAIAGGLGTDQLNKSGNLSAITVSGIETINTNGGTLTATAAQLEGVDTIRFSAAQASATISLVQAGAGSVDLTDEVLGRRVLYQGSSGNDTVSLSDGADRLDGGAGDDTLNGGLGNDQVLGGIGNDLIVQGSADGRDLIDGGAGADTYRLTGTAAAETFRIMTRAEAVLAGITGLAGATEIVITRNGTDTASVIAELDNIEEIEIDSLLATANNGNGVVDGGSAGGDTIIVMGDFTTTSLDYSTISIQGSAGSDTIDISGLTSAHRVVFTSNGGEDALIGTPRPQDVFGLSDGIEALMGPSASRLATPRADLRDTAGRDMPARGLDPAAHVSTDDTLDPFLLQAMLDRPYTHIGRTIIDTLLDQRALDIAIEIDAVDLVSDLLPDIQHSMHETCILPSEVDYILG